MMAAVNKPPRSGWTCPKCGEPNLPAFGLCWNCGTTPDGQPGADFVVDLETLDGDSLEPVWTQPQFSLRSALIAILLVAIVLSIGKTLGAGAAVLLAASFALVAFTEHLLRGKAPSTCKAVMTAVLIFLLLLFVLNGPRFPQ